MVIGALAEVSLPAVAICLEQTMGCASAAAFVTGVVRGYNGDLLETSHFSAEPTGFISECAGKCVGTLLSLRDPTKAFKSGKAVCRMVAGEASSTIASKVGTSITKEAIKDGNKIASRATLQTAQKGTELAENQVGKRVAHNNQWKFPENPAELLPDLPRDRKGHIYASDQVRIRPEKHAMEKPGDVFNPRHHGQHYHVEGKINHQKSWNNEKNIYIIKPNEYEYGKGTGFLPGEYFPGYQ